MLTITPQTKISELIKQNPDSIRAIASLAKPLEKLQNPILRKIMASRVTIAEAAKMGGTTEAEFRRVLEPLGFNFKTEETERAESAEKEPHWLRNADRKDIDFYDVRPIIDEGSDPLKQILHRFKEVEPGKILCVINSFVPTPLIHLLKQEKAEDAYVETVGAQEFNTYFLKQKTDVAAPAVEAKEQLTMSDENIFADVCAQFGETLTEIDVRALEMPGPMHEILGKLEEISVGNALFVHHKRVPVYLLEELADKNYEVHIHERGEDDVKMLIIKR